MKSYDFYACTYDSEVFCNECLPDGMTPDSDDVSPVFADSEWDYYPTCSECGEKHDYVSLTADGAIYEADKQGYEVFWHDADHEDGDCWETEEGERLPSGWYWWSCQPGCLPDGGPSGPYDSESEAAFAAIDY